MYSQLRFTNSYKSFRTIDSCAVLCSPLSSPALSPVPYPVQTPGRHIGWLVDCVPGGFGEGAPEWGGLAEGSGETGVPDGGQELGEKYERDGVGSERPLKVEETKLTVPLSGKTHQCPPGSCGRKPSAGAFLSQSDMGLPFFGAPLPAAHTHTPPNQHTHALVHMVTYVPTDTAYIHTLIHTPHTPTRTHTSPSFTPHPPAVLASSCLTSMFP